jgi:AraC-like DNA-binding protein
MDETDPAATRPTCRFASADVGSTARAYQLFRAFAEDIAGVKAIGAAAEFGFVTEVVHLGPGVLVDATLSPVAYDRSSQHVARSAIDHYQVSMYVEGKGEFRSGPRTAALEAGDICLIDMSQPSEMRLVGDPAGRTLQVVTLILPRSVLAPLLAAPDAVQASVISRNTAFGRLMGEHMLALRRYAPLLSDEECRSAVQATAHLAAGAVGRAPDAAPAVVLSTRAAQVAAIKRHINEHLDSSRLGVNNLCHRFHLSRAALYRLFEHEGGLARYIQDRRLYRAFSKLVAPAHQDWRIIDFALDAGFSSDATFIRAFRRVFGMTPGEVRTHADLARAGHRLPLSGPADAMQSASWLRHLTR